MTVDSDEDIPIARLDNQAIVNYVPYFGPEYTPEIFYEAPQFNNENFNRAGTRNNEVASSNNPWPNGYTDISDNNINNESIFAVCIARTVSVFFLIFVIISVLYLIYDNHH